MKLESNTLFMKIFFLVALAVITSNLVWFLLLHTLSAEPRAKAIAQVAVSTVNLVRTSLYAAAPERKEYLLREFSRNEGIFLHSAASVNNHSQQKFLVAKYNSGDGDALLRLVQREVQQKLGNDTRIAIGINNGEGLWVSFKFNQNDKDEYWLELSRYVQHSNMPPLLIWGALTTIIVIVVSWKLAQHISLPLIRLAKIATAFGNRNNISSNSHNVDSNKNFDDTLKYFQQNQEVIDESSSKEIQSLTSSFFEMINNLSDNEKEREIVLAGISHDLRTPLTRLRLEVEMNLCDDSESQQEMIYDIEQIEDVIRQFMEYARTNYIGTPELCNPLQIFDEIQQNEILHSRPLKTCIEGNFMPIKLHKNAMIRAIINLINNAWKYGKPPVELKAFIREKFLIIEVMDYGNGVKPEQMPNLTHPFARGEAARSNVTGTGLGLAIVERITKYHNGKLEFESGQQEQFKGKFGLLARIILPIE